MARRQHKELIVLGFIIKYVQTHLYAPTIREIGEGVNLKSTSSVVYYLEKLEEEGLITYVPNSPRAIGIKGYKVVEIDEM